jgi:hypothetical protein
VSHSGGDSPFDQPPLDSPLHRAGQDASTDASPPARRSHSRGLAGIAVLAGVAVLSVGVVRFASGGAEHGSVAASPPPPTLGGEVRQSLLAEGAEIGSAIAASNPDSLGQALLRLSSAGAYGTVLANGICSGADTRTPLRTPDDWRAYLVLFVLQHPDDSSVSSEMVDDLIHDWRVAAPDSAQVIRRACRGQP